MNEMDESYITKTKLKPFMQSSCHRGFDNNLDDNFFKVYDKLFRQLDREEELEEQVGSKHQSYPRFGDYNASAEEVFAFYENWQYFTTCKPFAYADLYNESEAPNRRIKRLIEIENNKERKRERQEFNDMVRELIAKLKDKDPRYKKFALIR